MDGAVLGANGKPIGPARRWSCETCRRRKIRCDGVRPSCGFCLRKNLLPCVFLGTKNRTDIDLARQFEAERRRRRLEDQQLSLLQDAAATAQPMKKIKSIHDSIPVGFATPTSATLTPIVADGSWARLLQVSGTNFEREPSSGAQSLHGSSSLGRSVEERTSAGFSASSVGNNEGRSAHRNSRSQSTPEFAKSLPKTLNPHNQTPAANVVASPTSGFFGAASNPSSPPSAPSPVKPVDWDDPDLRRPGSAPGEQYALAVLFFKFSPFSVLYTHRRTVLKNFGSISPLLRMAICACGASMHIASSLGNDVSHWYYEKACAITAPAIQHPTIESFQSMLILLEVASSIGLRSTWWGRIQLTVSMAIALNLNVDPDSLPIGVLKNDSWLEKETRRRCWWGLYLVETTLAVMFFQKPLITRALCSVEPVCSDEVWFSAQDPATLEHRYNLSRGPTVNSLTYRIRLSDINNEIVLCATPEPLAAVDLVSLSNTEKRLEQELEAYKKSYPREFSLQLSEDWVFETMDADYYRFQQLVGQFISYHGARCHLMRRRVLVHLREVSASLAGSRLTPDEENRSALIKGVASALALGKLLGILLKSPGAIQRYPFFLILPTIQGYMTLMMADGLFPAFTETPNLDQSPGNEVNFDEIPQHIDSYLQLLRTVGKTNKSVNNLATVLEKFRSSDWTDLESLCNNPSKIVSVDYVSDGSELDVNNAGPLHRRVRIISTVVRECLSGIRTAREISNRMTPPQTVGQLAPRATGNLGRPLASTNWMELLRQPQPLEPRTSKKPTAQEPAGNNHGSSVSDGSPVTSTPDRLGSDGGDLGGLWFEGDAPLADNPDDGDNAMVLLDWLFSADPSMQ
ncbi:hypothetical protein DFJ73DRAFT_823881 [Zopfochytrium polystomum]|nr:hypothetical protein DFJ73DRAFT_823881 [Zopfochytrium polystomum]